MRNLFKKIASIFLVLLVLFSSLAFTIEKHLCGGRLFSESLFGNAEKCGMDTMQCKELDLKIAISKENCCKNEFQFTNGAIFNQELHKLPQFLGQLFTFIEPNISFFTKYSFNKLLKKVYFPPPKIPKLTILYQVFRI